MIKIAHTGLKYIKYQAIFLLLMISSCETDTLSPAQSQAFLKLFGSFQNDAGYDVKALSDGGYVITGSITTEDKGKDVFLIKTDKSGNESWKSKLYGGLYDDTGYSIELLPDGGFIILGSITEVTYAGNKYTNMYLIRTTSEGETVWAKKYGGRSEDGKGEVGYDVKVTSDGGFILIGSTANYGMGGKDVWLVKTDMNGDTLWTRTHGGTNDDVGKSIAETSYGYIFTGYTRSFSEPGQAASNIFVVKTNTLGKEVFPYTYGGMGEDYGESVIVLPGGGYLIAGSAFNPQTSTMNVSLIKIEEQLTQVAWSKLFGGQVNHFGMSLKSTPDNGFMITGTQELSSSNHNAFLLKINTEGTQELFNTFGGSGLQRAESLDITSDGGCVITGSNEYEGNSMITLIKIIADSNM